ncbi:MAG: hypothetical protein JW986_04180 [Methanotrichaceae archaeon]|nr:hypothetical protein [Methanotrichaceae archaeon]
MKGRRLGGIMHSRTISPLFGCSIPAFSLFALIALLLIALAPILFVQTGAALPSALVELNPPGYLSDDYYKVTGGPDLELALERSSAYQGEERALFLTLVNRGHLLSFQVNEQPDQSRREEVLAAKKEAELEAQRTTAQEISIALRPANESAMEVKREVAYTGSLREGQTSPRLEFPLEVFRNTTPGEYTLLATVNYTYQRDVAVVGKDERPENPDIYYWFDNASQTYPLQLLIERHSDAVFEITKMEPAELSADSKDNVLKVVVRNVGVDTAYDLVSRLRPEAGIYVSVDQSSVPCLLPGREAELVYKLDLSKDAVPGKRYRLTLLFDFSDSYREDLEDSLQIYLTVAPKGTSSQIWPLALAVLVIAAVAMAAQRRRSRGG